MTDNIVTLTLSDALYQRAQRLAAESDQPLETILTNRLEIALDDLAGLPLDEQAELAALPHLSDDALWAMARERLPQDADVRQQELGERNSRGQIKIEEYAELERLVDRGNRLMVRKAEALAILTRRGWQISPQDLLG